MLFGAAIGIVVGAVLFVVLGRILEAVFQRSRRPRLTK
jgi:hypothetical protein